MQLSGNIGRRDNDTERILALISGCKIAFFDPVVIALLNIQMVIFRGQFLIHQCFLLILILYTLNKKSVLQQGRFTRGTTLLHLFQDALSPVTTAFGFSYFAFRKSTSGRLFTKLLLTPFHLPGAR